MPGKRTELDTILDEALASYGKAEPLAGLEERIVSRVRATQRPARGKSAAIMAAMVLAVSAIVCAVLIGVFPTPSRPKPPVLVSTAGQVEDKLLPPKRVQVPAMLKPKSSRRQAAPKEPTFPMRSPVTEQERLLLVLVTRKPGAAAELDKFRQRQSAPIEIAPLDVPELPNGS